MSEPWFDENTFAALYGGVVGGGLGTLGGIVGALAGALAPRGRGRTLVMGMMWLLLAVGVSQLALGLYALADGQPFHIWFWPCQVGGIVSAVVGGLIPVVRKRYGEAETRRLEAEAFRRS